MTVKAVTRYLARHAEPEAALATRIDGRFDAVVVMPAMGEGPEALDGLGAATGGLAIVVVNARDDHPAEVHAANSALLAMLDRRADGARRGRIGGLEVLLIDRASPGRRLPARQGVGLARKIGCDVALALVAAGKLGSRWIHWADADAALPEDFLAAAERAPGDAVALSYPFEHHDSGDAAVDAAHRRYECYLRYYRLGLQAAGSPYAHHTIGSALAFDASTYAVMRGVPRLLAAEDFYALGKAAKLGPVATPRSAPIRIRARRSSRVPFGTGRATAEIASAAAAGDDYLVDHPHGFALLGAWLGALAAVVETRSLPSLDAHFAKLAAGDRATLTSALSAIGAVRALEQALADRSAASLRRRIDDWFDGFRTLKLLHTLRDRGLGETSWRTAIARAPFLAGIAAGDDESLRRELWLRDYARLIEMSR